jgi:hypothetical protein
MRNRTKRLAAWVAILAIALQAIFAGLAGGLAIAASFDPAATICHGDASNSGMDRQTPSLLHDCCSDCILCSTLSAATPPDSFMPFVPSAWLPAAFIPFSAVAPTSLHGLAIYLARGPPRGA